MTEVETPGKSQENHEGEECFKDSTSTPEVYQPGRTAAKLFLVHYNPLNLVTVESLSRDGLAVTLSRQISSTAVQVCLLHPAPCRGKHKEHHFPSADCRGAVVWNDNLSILLPRCGRQVQAGRLYTPVPQMCWLTAPTCDGGTRVSRVVSLQFTPHVSAWQ